MLSEIEKAERAEFIQSIKALAIPSSLFLACVIMAGGAFLVYNNEPIGWAFVAVSLTTVFGAFWALLCFHNKYRAQGILKHPNLKEEVLEFTPDEPGVQMQATSNDTVNQSSSNSLAGRN
jgi:hypothetical protein